MKRSIRTFLLINLFMSIMLTTSLMVIANLYLNHKKIQSYIDKQLMLDGLVIQALLGDNPNAIDLKKIQASLDNIEEIWQQYYSESPLDFQVLKKNIEIKVWDKNNNLVLDTSPSSLVKIPLTNLGLSYQNIDHVNWRTFLTRHPLTGFNIGIAQSYEFHQELENKIAQNAILILLIAFPLLTIMVWAIIGRGLASINQVAKEIKNRAPSYLKALDFTTVPSEIAPLVKELNNLLSKLRNAFTREERFAADAAHELRTPLAALRAHAHVALNATSEEERNEALNKILIGLDRSTHVVQQLLILSKIATSDLVAKKEQVNLNKVAAEIIAELFPLAAKRNIDIELIAPDKPVIISGNTTTIGILIKNLIDNAIRYIDEGGLIQTIIAEENGIPILKVIDNGPGIPKELYGRVFERFVRGTGTKATGSGLGLSIVQQIIRQHNATIALDTPASGKGLMVVITFPETETAPQAEPINKSSAKQ